MTAAVVAGVLATALVVAAAGALPPPVRRLPAPAFDVTGRGALRGPLRAVGRRVRRAGLRASPLGDRSLGAVAVALAVLAPVVPPLAGLGALAVWSHPRLLERRQRAAADRAVSQALPDTVDLLRLCTGAGLSLALAHPLVAARAPAPLGPALAAAAAAAEQGIARADALHSNLAPLGDAAAGLAHVLGDHLRYGAPLEPTLARLSDELRSARRRAAEVDARRVPVRLLGPLVACTLPAFALLTVVPLLAASLEALPG